MKQTISKLSGMKRFAYIFIPITVALIVALVIFIIYTSGKINIEDSIVSSPLLNIYPASNGVLRNIYVKDGEKVKKGDPLAVVGTQTLYSPTNGRIADINESIGGDIVTTDSVIQIINPDLTRVDGVIDENKGLDMIKTGDVVSFTVDALPGKVFWGYVDEVSQIAKATQVAFTISSQRPTQQFDVYAKFDAVSNPEIKEGMSAKMTAYIN